MDFLFLFFVYSVIGIPFTVACDDWLQYNSKLLVWFYSAFFGVVYFSFSQLMLGYYHVPLIGPIAFIVKIGMFLLPYIIFCWGGNREKLLDIFSIKSWKFRRKNLVDLLFSIITFAMFSGFIWCLYTDYQPKYDEYRIWLVNAKYIFEHGELRFDRNILDVHASYNSFFTMPIVNYYEFKGKILEGRAPLVTIFWAFLFLGILWDMVVTSSNLRKSIVLLTGIVVILSFTNPFLRVMFTSYIEVPIACIIFMFMNISFIHVKSKKNIVSQIVLLVVMLYILYTCKSGFRYFAYVLAMAAILYQIQLRRRNSYGWSMKSLSRMALPIYCIVGFVTLLLVSHNFYFDHIRLNGSVPFAESHFIKVVSHFNFRRIWYLLKSAGLFYWVCIIPFVAIFIFNRNLKRFYLIGVIISLIGIVMVGYLDVSTDKKILNHSFYRYVSHGFFLIPLLLIDLSKKNKWRMIIMNILLYSLMSVAIYSVYIFVAYRPFYNWSIKSGSVCEVSNNKVKYACEKSISIEVHLKEGDKVVFADGLGKGNMSELLIQYLLLEYRVCGETNYYHAKIKKNEKIFNCDHDYILGFELNKTQILPLDKNYLRKGRNKFALLKRIETSKKYKTVISE